MREDKKAIKRKFNYKKGRETKITHFCLQTRELIRVERQRKKKKRKKEESSKGMEILKFCMDSSLILYKNYLGMDY